MAVSTDRRLNPSGRYDQLAVSGGVNRVIVAAISANPRWFWQGRAVYAAFINLP